MSESEKHFVGYHNTEKMGGPIQPATSYRVVTGKPTKRLEGNLVWMIAGEGNKPRQYSLASLFRVTETGNTGEDSLKNYAEGHGVRFDPPIRLTDLPWFDELSKGMNRFQFGVQELKDDRLISELMAAANLESLP